MALTEKEIFEKYAKECKHCSRKTLLQYEYELTCVSYGYTVLQGKNEPAKIQRRKISFYIRLKYAQHKKQCTCIDVFETHDGDVSDKVYRVLSELK